MIHKIIRKVIASSDTITGSFAGCNITHLIFTSTKRPTSSDFLTLTLKTPGSPSLTIIPRLSLLPLNDISNIKYGNDPGLQDHLDAEVATPYDKWSFAIDLGSLRNVANGATLEYTIEMSQAQTYELAGIQLNTKNDHQFVYTWTTQLNGTFANLNEMYLYHATAFTDTVESLDLTGQINTDHGSFTGDIMLYNGLTDVFGRKEVSTTVNTVLCHASPDMDGDTGSYGFSGTGVTGFNVIQISVYSDYTRVSRGVIDETDRLIAKATNTNQKDPMQYTALKRAGLLRSVQDLRAFRGRLNI